MTWIDFLGYAASASVLITFCMSTMVPLRTVALCSNVLFASYGAFAHIYPVLIAPLDFAAGELGSALPDP